jgi:hypothetical protein
VEVSAIAQQLLAVFRVLDVNWITPEKVEDLLECIGRAIRDRRREYGRGAEKALASEAWEKLIGRGKEDSETEREVIRCVSGIREELARNLKITMSYRDEYALFIELRHQSRNCIVRDAAMPQWLHKLTYESKTAHPQIIGRNDPHLEVAHDNLADAKIYL